MAFVMGQEKARALSEHMVGRLPLLEYRDWQNTADGAASDAFWKEAG